jgi:formyl-CoA transferase
VDVPVARVARPEDLGSDPQLLAREMVERHPHPSVGEVVFHGNPIKFSDAEVREVALAPDLGEHNELVYGQIGLDAGELERLRAEAVI